jgi:glucose-6-phosphate isomerase
MAVELPDEAIHFGYAGAQAPAGEEWTPAAEMRARHFVSAGQLKDLQARLLQCRGQVAAEREMRNVPPELLPLEAGFIDLPQQTLDNFRRKQDASDLGRIITLSNRLRTAVDRVVILGTENLTLGGLSLFQALRSAGHNELSAEDRTGHPRLYFDGHDFDNDGLQDLLELLQISCVDPEKREERWGVVVLSHSGATLETAAALRSFRREAAEFYGSRSPWLTEAFAAVTGKTSKLRELFTALHHGEDDVLTIPDNVGDRFAVFTAAGLLPAALVGLDVRAMLLGAAAMTRRFLDEPFERNPVLQLVAVNYLTSAELGKSQRVLAVWSRRLEALGRWYAALVAGSLNKHGRGPTPVTTLMPRDLHTRGQQQEGPRDSFVLNLSVKSPRTVPIALTMADRNEDDLNAFNRKTHLDCTAATYQAIARSNFDLARPAAEMTLPTVSEHTLGQLMQLLMLATVLEARLMGVNPYGQPTLDTVQRNVRNALSETKPPSTSRDST